MEAKELGYSEANPEQDIGGFDACRKLAILLSLATGMQVDYRDILTEGISELQPADFEFAGKLGCNIKLIADGRIVPGGVEAEVAPMCVSAAHPLSNISGVFNGVLVKAKVTDEVIFIGRGAGKFPTAGAVISDIVDAAKHLHRHIMHTWSQERVAVLPHMDYIKSHMIRFSLCGEAENAVYDIFGVSDITYSEQFPDMAAFIAPAEREGRFADKISKFAVRLDSGEPPVRYRIYHND
jgi:homoserine dehydrogenase